MNRRTNARRGIIIAVGSILVLSAIGVRTYIYRTAQSGVHDIVMRRIGKIEPRKGIQTFAIYGPRHGEIKYANSVWYSIEFRGVAELRDDDPSTEFHEDRLKAPRVKGRYRLTIKHAEKVMARAETDLSQWCNWYAPWQGTAIHLITSDSEFAMPIANRRYVVEFEWIEIPEPEVDCFHSWSYHTTRDLGF